jgi:hypothetical protein
MQNGQWQELIAAIDGSDAHVPQATNGTPATITVSGAQTAEGHGHWPNDTWHLQGENCGKPQWYRSGNPKDYIKWDGRRWTLNGMQPKCYFQNMADTPLPPQSGWASAEMPVTAQPTLTFGSVREHAADQRGEWKEYHNIDMAYQGDVEIIGDWKRSHSVESLKRIVEEKGYSAVCVGSFGHAALKKFDYQLTEEHCKPSSGYTNTLYIWFPSGKKVGPAESSDGAPTPEPDALKLVLTSRGAHNELKLEERAALASHKPAALTLASHPGLAIVTTARSAGPYGPWMVAPLGVGSAQNATTATLDSEGFLAYAHGGSAAKVLDVAHWKYELGNDINFVGHISTRSETFKPGGGRSFVLNDDGSMSPENARHLTLGVNPPDCTLVQKGAAERLVLDSATAAALRSGQVTPLKLASHAGCAIIPKTDHPRRIDEWHISYQHLGVGPASAAMKVRMENQFILSEHFSSRDFILDVPFGKLTEHCLGDHGKLPIAAINIERGENKEPNNAARLFQLNPDNTISPVRAAHLVFGMRGALPVPPTPDSTNETEDDWVALEPSAPAAEVDSYGVPLLRNTQ